MTATSRQTVGEIAERVCAALEQGDTDGACDVLDRYFFEAGWGVLEEALRPGENLKLKADVRGLVAAVWARARESK